MDSSELRFNFGLNGSARLPVDEWATGEAELIWTSGAERELVLSRPAEFLPQFLALTFCETSMIRRNDVRTVRVLANDSPVGNFTVPACTKTVRTCVIPRRVLVGQQQLKLVFQEFDNSDLCTGKSDVATLSLESLRIYPDRGSNVGHLIEDDGPVPVSIDAVIRADALSESHLMNKFESLGQTSEFGHVQRRCFAGSQGLLRFGTASVPDLVSALNSEFANMAKYDNLSVEISANGKDLTVKDNVYRFVYSAHSEVREIGTEEARLREACHLPFLIRKMLDDLQSAEKIFVFKSMEIFDEEVVFPIAAALRRYGPNTLLFVTSSEENHAGGSVEVRGSGFLVGYLGRPRSGGNVHDNDLAQWILLCRNALRLVEAVRQKQ